MEPDYSKRVEIPRAEAACIMGLMLLAYLVRWIPALYPHFWFDEIFTIAMSQNSFGEILRINAGDMHPPLYYDWVKCLAMAGSHLGGPFETLPWLRLASIIPGMLTCVLGWAIAHRYWGRTQALWTLAAFAVAPTLTYYSVDLRSYSMLHAFLLGAFFGLLRFTEPTPGVARWPATVFCGLCALGAFYTHSLSTLYLGGMGLVFLVEWRWNSPPVRRELAWHGALLALFVALGCAPWIRIMFPQLASLNAENWLAWAQWSDLRTTFFWYMPLGPLNMESLKASWHDLIMMVMALLTLLLVANAWRNRHQAQPAAAAGNPAFTLHGHRLLLYSGLLVIAPILVSFFLSYFHIAKAFLGFRYNLIPAPFITLALVGLIFRIITRRWRVAALAAFISFKLACSGLLIHQRLTEFDIIGEVARAKPEVLRPDSRMVWNNPMVVPWLGARYGSHRLRSLDDILAGRVRLGSHETIYVLTHLALDDDYSGLLHRRSFLFREILKRHGIRREEIKGHGAWDGAWRLTAADIPVLSTALQQALDRIEARRSSIKGGQVLLADEENFYITDGWAPLQYGPDLLPERWTVGTQPHLTWAAPSRPGLYRLRMSFIRRHPFPDKNIVLRYRLPGEKVWRSQQAGLGQVVIEGDIQVKTPGEKLRIRLQLPPWNTWDGAAGKMPDRHLGLLFQALELSPRDQSPSPQSKPGQPL